MFDSCEMMQTYARTMHCSCVLLPRIYLSNAIKDRKAHHHLGRRKLNELARPGHVACTLLSWLTPRPGQQLKRRKELVVHLNRSVVVDQSRMCHVYVCFTLLCKCPVHFAASTTHVCKHTRTHTALANPVSQVPVDESANK